MESIKSNDVIISNGPVSHDESSEIEIQAPGTEAAMERAINAAVKEAEANLGVKIRELNV